MTTIVLVGMPGSGKSTVGCQLARRLELAFVELGYRDRRLLGCSIRSHFEQHGEASFRDVEQEVLAGLLGRDSGRGHWRRRRAARSEPAAHAVAGHGRTCARPRGTDSSPAARHQSPAAAGVVIRCASCASFPGARPSVPRSRTLCDRDRRTSVKMLAGTILMQLELAGVIDPAHVPSVVLGSTLSDAERQRPTLSGNASRHAATSTIAGPERETSPSSSARSYRIDIGCGLLGSADPGRVCRAAATR